jgi:hypothetical protein
MPQGWVAGANHAQGRLDGLGDIEARSLGMGDPPGFYVWSMALEKARRSCLADR